MVNSAWSGNGVLGASSDFSNDGLLNATNAQRIKDGEPLLSLSARLDAAAQAKAEDMVRHDYWAHDSPSGKTPWSFIAASGYQYRSAGENLAYGFSGSEAAVAGWMNSAEHRANILDANYADVGFGVASSTDFVGQGPETVVVAEYAQPASLAGAPADTHPTTKVLDNSTQRVSRIQILTGSQSEWSLLAVMALSGGAMILFVLRHGYRLHRWLSRGEAFVTKHPYLDIFVVFVITAGCVLTRISGIVG